MRAKRAKAIRKLALLQEQKSDLVRLSTGQIQWNGFRRLYQRMKKNWVKGLALIVLMALLGCSSSRISVYERYPAEWGIRGTRFLKLDSEVSLRTPVGTERRLTIVISNDYQGVPLLSLRIYLKIPVEFSVRKTTIWRHASSNEKYHTYYAEFDSVVYNDEIRGPDESLFVKFLQTGKYRFEFLVQGIMSDGIAKSEGSFIVEVF